MDQSISEPKGLKKDGFERYAILKVKDAVARGQITREHGELLAALHEDVQETALAALLAVQPLPTISDLKGSIKSRAVPLTQAPCASERCASCRYNSNNHEGLFEVNIGAGYCVSSRCEPEPEFVSKPVRKRATPRKKRESQSTLDEYKSRLWRTVLCRHVESLSTLQQRSLMLAFLTLGWNAGNRLSPLLGRESCEPVQTLVAEMALNEPEQVTAGLNQVVRALIGEAPIQQVLEAARGLGIRLNDHWTLNAAALAVMPMDDLDKIAADTFLAATPTVQAARELGQQSYADAMAIRLDGIDIQGYIPACLQY